jgi:hypothetical protein
MDIRIVGSQQDNHGQSFPQSASARRLQIGRLIGCKCYSNAL